MEKEVWVLMFTEMDMSWTIGVFESQSLATQVADAHSKADLQWKSWEINEYSAAHKDGYYLLHAAPYHSGQDLSQATKNMPKLKRSRLPTAKASSTTTKTSKD